MPQRSFSVLLAIVLTVPGFAQKDKNQIFTDPKKAGPDFAIQGEYVGELPDNEGGTQKWGVQVIAQGNGKFQAVAYPGGLPGDGWTKEGKLKAQGETKNGITRLNSDMGYAFIKDGEMTIFSNEDRKLGELKKVLRESPTLGARPPEDAIVLFDGKVNNFTPGKTEGDLLAIPQRSKHIFAKDFHLHIEFRTPFRPMARGQRRGNSGAYLLGRFEVQVLDSFGLEGKKNECGGLYGRKDCDLNMCFPPLSWQTYDIDFQVARYDDKGKMISPALVTVKHNGTIIHNKVKLGKSNPKGGPLTLQNHGNPVHYRNIWVVEKK